MRQPDFEEQRSIESAFGQMRLRRYVSPFYLKLMGFGAADVDHDLAAKVRNRGRKLSGADVSHLLQMHWRPQVMGAWYAIAARDPLLSTAVHDSLETSLGHLTSPPLITAALAYPNDRTTALLHDYIQTDLEQQWGAAGFAAAAALSRLEPSREQDLRAGSLPPVSTEDIEVVDKLVLFGRALQSD